VGVSKKIHVKIFSSFEEEEAAERLRCRQQSDEEREEELREIRRRAFGPDWHRKPMVKVASIEKTNW